MKKLFTLFVMAAVGAAVYCGPLPDIKRYLEMRRM